MILKNENGKTIKIQACLTSLSDSQLTILTKNIPFDFLTGLIELTDGEMIFSGYPSVHTHPILNNDQTFLTLSD